MYKRHLYEFVYLAIVILSSACGKADSKSPPDLEDIHLTFVTGNRYQFVNDLMMTGYVADEETAINNSAISYSLRYEMEVLGVDTSNVATIKTIIKDISVTGKIKPEDVENISENAKLFDCIRDRQFKFRIDHYGNALDILEAEHIVTSIEKAITPANKFVGDLLVKSLDAGSLQTEFNHIFDGCVAETVSIGDTWSKSSEKDQITFSAAYVTVDEIGLKCIHTDKNQRKGFIPSDSSDTETIVLDRLSGWPLLRDRTFQDNGGLLGVSYSMAMKMRIVGKPLPKEL
jgi:hypothetical protein